MRPLKFPYTINGFFFRQRLTGVQRVAYETVRALDKICDPGEFVLATPENAIVPPFRNIEVCRFGKGSLPVWEQAYFSRYLFENNSYSINLCQSAPLACTDFFSIYDCAYKTHPEFFDGIHGALSRFYHMLLFRIATGRSSFVLTDSVSAKKEICRVYGLSENQVVNIGCGWEHIEHVEVSGNEAEELRLTPNEFFFSLGGGKNKNIEWMLEVACRNPQQNFVIAGKKAASNRSSYQASENVRFLGYVSDSQVKALMQNCKAFLFPSTYEGFGLPPLEALACGSKIVVSDIPVFRETYGASAIYINPFRYDYDMNEVIATTCDASETVLNDNTWAKSAERLLRLVESLSGEVL